jgi:hypothetical protein
MRFYKGSLTRRLILDTSIDNELEESIVIQLRVRTSEKKSYKFYFWFLIGCWYARGIYY